MTKVVIFVILLLTFERACTKPRAAATGQRASVATHEVIELEILRAVFQYQMQRCYRDRNLGLYFLSYTERDPPDEVLKSLSDPHFEVQPRSQMSAFREKGTGKPGVLLAVREITLRTNTTADVSGSCGAAALDASTHAPL